MVKQTSISDRTKIGILGDESTINGFKLTGINGTDTAQSAYGVVEYLYVINSTTEDTEIISKFNILAERKEIAMILINQRASEALKEELDRKTDLLPIVMEIPTKNTAPSITEVNLLKRLKELAGKR
ncbi:V-type H+-transporting ATPase subunit F [Nematocida sp. AWRm80]|nr:V-type H+-transporting ATPase subunit F [Nematocida sp. AWRm80]